MATIKKWKIEASLRLISTVLFLLTAVILGFNTETKVLFHAIKKKATFRDLNALFTGVWINTAGAAYSLIQLVRLYKLPGPRKELEASNRYTAWAIYLLDQTATYILFAANLAAMQASFLAITGEKGFQWIKLCNTFSRFCVKIGIAVAFGTVGAILMAIVSSISAYSLFRLYSPKHILMLKQKQKGEFAKNQH